MMPAAKNSNAIHTQTATGHEGTKTLSTYLQTPPAETLVDCLHNDFDDLGGQIDFSNVAENVEETPESVIERLDEAESYARGLLETVKKLQAGFIDHLGLIDRMNAAAIELQNAECNTMRDVIAEGLRLQEFSARRLPKDLLENLAALGMPKTFHGRSTRTFSGAAQSVASWLPKAGTGPA